ncbi:uncharacterized protein [Salmo salar]|uniref:Uncharacterized protein LOC123724489 isoform X1 n=1 Tax=Salmo salar TaxID=8030 RepID=A0ABM3D787_SALSA|nr:uncharacterized protein LOC123724489 isoform X1 [Salmo salar]XP_045544225.1 uncharacterized protein LOC123724489 isoform X1 [Salmo salar]XP_045554667.1 uncharacterized protein LOC123728120 [Salmo salar]XP_045554668.1 uncharacterized protein LOC123728120 [Salmo salar]
MQKVTMLPRMPGVKTALFTRRIVAYHETFATIGKKSQKKKKTISVVWHEGTAGQKAEEITSSYVTALERERDVKNAVYWVDNCTSQNKNWCLLTTLVSVVNADSTLMEDITLKFFELGHTFMSADSYHHGVEQEMKARPGGVVYDFGDFLHVVATSNAGKVEVVEMKKENILAWKAGHSIVKLKKAAAPVMAEIQLRRGSRSLFYKVSHEEKDFTELDFIMKKVTLETPSTLRTQDRGIEESKKMDIITKLCPLMPANRRQFWNALAVNSIAEDEE